MEEPFYHVLDTSASTDHLAGYRGDGDYEVAGTPIAAGAALRSSDPTLASPTESPVRRIGDSNNNRNKHSTTSSSTSSVYYAQIIYDEYERMKKDNPSGGHNRVPLVINPIPSQRRTGPGITPSGSATHFKTSSDNILGFTNGISSFERASETNSGGSSICSDADFSHMGLITLPRVGAGKKPPTNSTLSRPNLPPPPPPPIPDCPPESVPRLPSASSSSSRDSNSARDGANGTSPAVRTHSSTPRDRPLPERPDSMSPRPSSKSSKAHRSQTPAEPFHRRQHTLTEYNSFSTMPNKNGMHDPMPPMRTLPLPRKSQALPHHQRVGSMGGGPQISTEMPAEVPPTPPQSQGALKKIAFFSLKKLLKKPEKPTPPPHQMTPPTFRNGGPMMQLSVSTGEWEFVSPDSKPKQIPEAPLSMDAATHRWSSSEVRFALGGKGGVQVVPAVRPPPPVPANDTLTRRQQRSEGVTSPVPVHTLTRRSLSVPMIHTYANSPHYIAVAECNDSGGILVSRANGPSFYLGAESPRFSGGTATDSDTTSSDYYSGGVPQRSPPSSLKPPKRPVRIISFRTSQNGVSGDANSPCYDLPPAEYVNSLYLPSAMQHPCQCGDALEAFRSSTTSMLSAFVNSATGVNPQSAQQQRPKSFPLLDYSCIYQPDARLCALFLTDLLNNASSFGVSAKADSLHVQIPPLDSGRRHQLVFQPTTPSANQSFSIENVHSLIVDIIYICFFHSHTPDRELLVHTVAKSSLVPDTFRVFIGKMRDINLLLACINCYLWGPVDNSELAERCLDLSSAASHQPNLLDSLARTWLDKETMSLVHEVFSSNLPGQKPVQSPSAPNSTSSRVDKAMYLCNVSPANIVAAVKLLNSNK